MNEEARTINAWQKTQSFQSASDPNTLKAPASMRQYLENRLVQAFQDGMKAGKSIAVMRMQKKLNNLISDTAHNMNDEA